MAGMTMVELEFLGKLKEAEMLSGQIYRLVFIGELRGATLSNELSFVVTISQALPLGSHFNVYTPYKSTDYFQIINISCLYTSLDGINIAKQKLSLKKCLINI